MKILLNGIGCPNTGARKVLEEILAAAPQGHTIVAILPLDKNYSYPNFNIKNNIKPIYFNHGIWGKYLRPILELFIIMELLFKRYDVFINLSNYSFSFFKNQILYIHNRSLIDVQMQRGFGEGKPNIFIDVAFSLCLPNSKKIFVQSEHIKELLLLYCEKKKIKLHSGVHVLKPKPRIALNCDNHYESDTGTFYFIYPTKSGYNYKNNDLAISAVGKICEEMPSIKLKITLSSTCKQNGIEYLGYIGHDLLIEEMFRSSCLLFTSTNETLGLPLLEALYLEKPAVLPNLPYAKEIYDDAAVYFEPNNLGSLIESIKTMHNNYDYYKTLVKSKKKIEWNKRQNWEQHWTHFLE